MAGRNFLAEREGVKKAQDASTYILGWFAQAASIVAGGYAATSWPGSVIRWPFELFPAWVIVLTLFIGGIAWAIDIINDLTPNQAAITVGFVGPILAASSDATGNLAAWIREWSAALRSGLGDQLGGWVGNVGPGPLSIALMAMAVIIGKRVLAKQASAARGGGGR